MAKKPAESILAQALEDYRRVVDAESTVRAKMLEDWQFVEGAHWPEQIKTERTADSRPCLVIDGLSGPIRQVTNQILEMRPGIQVRPVDQEADPETAEILQGLIKHIETQSDADAVYTLASEHQVKMGRGFIRLLTEYVDDQTTTQEIFIRPVENPFAVYFDPSSTRPDYTDAKFCLIPEDLTFDEYEERYGKVAPKTALTALHGTGDVSPDWFPKNKIRIAEYFRVKHTTEDLRDAEGTLVRKIQRRTVHWYLLNATEILEERTVPGPYIPIVPVIGERTVINGVLDLKGMVRRAKDPVRMGDYWESALTEVIALAPRAPFIAYEGQLEGHEQEWETANRRNWSRLEVKATVPGYAGLLPLPQRQTAEPPIQAMVMASMRAENAVRRVTGFYSVEVNEPKGETSGRAILARQAQGETGNTHFLAHLAQAVRVVGRIILAWIPVYYDTPRIYRITGKGGMERQVLIGPGVKNQAMPAGIDAVADPSVGRYDVTITVGPSQQTKRMEAVQSMTQILQAAPELLKIIGDLYFGNMDWPEARQIAERLKKLLPPELQEDKPGRPGQGPGSPDPKMVQALVLQHEQLTQEVNRLAQERDAKTLELQAEMKTAQAKAQSAEAVAQLEAETKVRIAQMQIQSEEKIARLKARVTLETESANLQTDIMMAHSEPPEMPEIETEGMPSGA